jgi:hypothetical protein
MSRMTDEDIEAARREAVGWTGEFVYCDDGAGDSVVVFVPEDAHGVDDETCATITDAGLDDHVAESLAKMLSMPSRLLDEIIALRADLARQAEAAARAFMAGAEFMRDHADISEHDGWHRTDPRIEWPRDAEIQVARDAHVAAHGATS